MSNLIAYIPVLNKKHVEWFRKHPGSNLYLVGQELAEAFLPRLSRNMAALPSDIMFQMLHKSCSQLQLGWVSQFSITVDPKIYQGAILPDEDISHAISEEFLTPASISHTFEEIWARWDMTAMKKSSPVMADVEITFNHMKRLLVAKNEAKKSPDWWRQVGAALFQSDHCVAVGCNNHYPTEYEQDAKGDPRMNYNAGQIGKYLSYHAEKTVISLCADAGIPTRGSCLYTTVFPCEDCARGIVLAGIDHVFFEEGYSALDAQEILKGAGVKIVQIIKDPASA